MLDHTLAVVLNVVFWHWKATGLKVSKFIGIQYQGEHFGHVKQLKSDRYQDRNFLSQASDPKLLKKMSKYVVSARF